MDTRRGSADGVGNRSAGSELATAIVVARGGSRRLPNKALLPFAGATLVGHKVRTLLRCAGVGRVVVGSDSDAILAEGARHGATPVRRDDYHCDESRCSANEMIRDMVERVPGADDEVCLWAHPTNPLVRAETYDRALRQYASGRRGRRGNAFDSLFSATVDHRHAWFDFRPVNHDPWGTIHRPAAYLRPVCAQDGAIFIQTRARFLETSYFYGDRPLPYNVSRIEGWDIDTEADYRAALALCESQSSPAVPRYEPSPAAMGLASLSA